MAGNGAGPRGPRCIALVGPFQSGKTTLLEGILARTGAIARQGTVEAGSTVGDGSAEARHHKMSVEVSVATTNFLGDNYTFIDCPGSVEFVHDMRAVLPAVDAAVVVCEADEKKIPQLQLILRELEDLKIPRFLFLNKIDKADKRVRETLKVLQPASRVPLVLRQIPIWSDEIVVGFVDLALERALIYKEHAPSEVVPFEGENVDRNKEARFTMLESLADHDDELMEQLLDDIPPPRDKVFDDLAKELRDGLICPVLIGSATRTNGVLRLMKALRHEAPGRRRDRRRLGVKPGGEAVASVLKTLHTAHGGKMSIARLFAGQVRRRHHLHHARDRGRPRVRRVQADGAGEREARRRRRGRDRRARQARSCQDRRHAERRQAGARRDRQVTPYPPVLAIAVAAKERKDDVKLGQALNKLIDEDPSLTVVHNPETHEIVVWGQGEMHLRVATERLADRFGVAIERHKPTVGYRETIRKPVLNQRGRHKKQSGGHGQFGDVVIDVKPLPRGTGFAFDEMITGGAVPRNYIPAVEEGVHRRAQARAARLPGGRRRGDADRRLVSRGRFLRHGVPPRRPPRHLRSAAECAAGAARADPSGRDRLPERRDRQDQRDPVRAARADPRLRYARRLGRLGRREGDDARNRDRRPHHRGPLGDRRGRHLHRQVRPHGGAHRPHGRPDRRGEKGFCRSSLTVLAAFKRPACRCRGARIAASGGKIEALSRAESSA